MENHRIQVNKAEMEKTSALLGVSCSFRLLILVLFFRTLLSPILLLTLLFLLSDFWRGGPNAEGFQPQCL
jgi:hypothetical protein